jgi:cation transport regulator ChaC
MPLLFQYGSNCLTARLKSPQRLNGAAMIVGRAQTLDEYEIAFDVWSNGNGCAASDLIAATGTGHRAWGVLFEVPPDRIRGRNHPKGKTMEEIEGPRYEEKQIRVRNEAGEEVEATTFLVKPDERQSGLWTSAAYVSWIVYGLREHGAPEEYIAHVQEVAMQTNVKASAVATEQNRIITKL